MVAIMKIKAKNTLHGVIMKILLINGSTKNNGSCDFLLNYAKSELEARGISASRFDAGAAPRCACTSCGACKNGGGCVIRDIDELAVMAGEADGLAIFTPTFYGSASGNLLSILSRLCISSGGKLRYKPITVIGVGRRGCVSEAIHSVTRFFEFLSCPIIFGSYPAIVYAKDRKAAEYDAEGLQNLRESLKSLVWLTEVCSFGAKNNIAPPALEARIRTDISNLHEKFNYLA